MTLDSLPDLDTSGLCLVKTHHGTDVLAVSEHGAPGRRPNIHAHFVGRQREDGLDTLPARAAEANRSTLIADIPFPAPENVAATRCASEKRTREGHAAPHPEGFDPTLESPPDRHAAVSSALRLRDSPRLMLFGRGCTQWRGHGCFTSRNLDEGASGTCARAARH